MKQLLFICALISFVAIQDLTAQCSSIYFYRFDGFCSQPIYLYQDGKQLITLQPGERFKAEVCASGDYNFQVKLNNESIIQAKAVLAVDDGKNYFLKIGCVAGVDVPTIKIMDTAEGELDVAKDKRFVSAPRQINISPALSSGTTAGAKSTTSNSKGQASTAALPGNFKATQIVNNFKFELVDITRAGSMAQLNFKITNLASDDRILLLNRSYMHFYDDMGAIVYPDQLCLVDNCHNTYYTSCQGNRDCILSQGRRYEIENSMPSGIPLNASITFQKLNKRATKLVRGAIWFGCCENYNYRPVPMSEVPYSEIVFPSVIDPKNAQNRIIASLGVELKSCEPIGTGVRLNYTLRNLGDTPFDVVFQKGTAFDDQGNQYTIGGFAYASEARRPLNAYDNYTSQTRTLQSYAAMELQLFIDNTKQNIQSLRRVDLHFNGYDLSWDNAPIQRGKTPPITNNAYLSYPELQTKLGKKENVVGKKVILENIYFNSGSDQILSQSYTQLNQLSELLLANPTVKVEISGHTDSVGDDVSNMLLSQKRADAIKYFLISKSINPIRILSIGKGETEFIYSNDSEQDRSKNRRVEIKIIE